MHVVLAHDATIPVTAYGGTERLVWWLGRYLAAAGHRVTFLVPAGSRCDFAPIAVLRRDVPLEAQVPADADVLHAWFPLRHEPSRPYVVTVGGNGRPGERFERNTVFVSRDHAQRHGAQAYVHNAIDPADYGEPTWPRHRPHLLFLAKARWSVKNVQGAKQVARAAGLPLVVAGGRGVPWRGVRYAGMVGGERKRRLLNAAAALLFPVRWHEPFGLAVIEAMWFGVPVLATPYGSLPELVPPHVGTLASDATALVLAAQQIERYDRRAAHAWVRERFTIARMAQEYLALYDRVRGGEWLNAATPQAGSTLPTGLLGWTDVPRSRPR